MPNNSKIDSSVNDKYDSTIKSINSLTDEKKKAKFTEGLQKYQDITIPGFKNGMSSLEMKELFLSDKLTLEQKGALRGRINEAVQAESIKGTLNRTNVFKNDFQSGGSSFIRLIPQDFYLQLVGDNSGRCNALVRAMAVALASGGEVSINNLVDKLYYAAADPKAESSMLLKYGLAKLHNNVEASTQASKNLEGQFTLSEVANRLEKATGTSTFSLNTSTHAMMAGITVEAKGRRYYFYDPNVGIFAFDKSADFLSAMKKHLVNHKLASYYKAFGKESDPTFNLVEIDPDKMAKVPLNLENLKKGLLVADLTRPNELAALATNIGQQHRDKPAGNAPVNTDKDAQLRTTLAALDIENEAKKSYKAITNLAQQNNLDQRWIPVIGSIEEQGKGSYSVQFINRDHLDETRLVKSNDSTVFKFRRLVDKLTPTLSKHFNLEHGQLQFKGVSGEAAPVDGLNAGFAMLTLIHWFADKERNDAADGKASSDLATALKIHSYLNYAQITHAGVNDAANAINLVRTALRGEVMVAGTSLKQFSSTLAHTANEGIGVLLGGASVVLDAYELAHAETDTQKAVFGTQLAFDSASFVTSSAGIGAGLVGASTAAAVLGGAGVILGGLAVGFTALAQAFGAVAEDAQAVGRYFDMLDKAYKGNGYRYDSEKKVLIPLDGAVIKTLDLRKNQIGFDSQYIYRTRSGSTGSGEINYFFWIGDFPVMDHDRSQAIEVRSGIGYKEASHKLDHSDSDVIILPGTPKSFIKYEYMILPGATTRHDTGFDVIRRLEKDKRFDYDFYIFPGEQTIRRIHQEYVATPIEVVLDQHDRKLIVPKLPKELHGYLRYEIKGAGGEYLIGLNEGTSVKLISDVSNADGSSNVPSRWIIDSSQLASDTISVSKNQLKIGGVVVELDPSQNGQVLIVNGKNEVSKVDFSNQKTQVISEDASKWQVPGQQIGQHLKDLAKAHKLHGQYVVVENYKHGGHDVGRAFYDVARDRTLFTDTTHEQAKHAQLGAVMGDHAYFYDADNAVAWRVDIATGKVNAQFEPLFNQNPGKISRLWEEGEAVYLAYRYQSKEGKTELSYRIVGDRMELVSSMGDNELFQRLARTDRHSDELKAILRDYQSKSAQREKPVYTLGGRLIQPTSAELVAISGTDAAGIAHRYWIRTSDGTLIKPNLEPLKEQTLNSKENAPRGAWQIPDDLVLAGSISRPAGMEVFFFYSKTKNALFRQEGPGQAVFDANHPTALRINTPPLANVVNMNGNLLAITEDGRVAQLDASGQFNYEAVNEHWLKEHTHWWQDLASVTNGGTTLALLGVKGTDGKSLLPAWYHNGQVVVASATLQGKSLQFLGFEADGTAARLFEPKSGKLYLQKMMTTNELATAFGSGLVLNASAPLPVAKELTPELSLKAAQQVNDGMRLITAKGEILVRTHQGELRLVGVDKNWHQNNSAHLSQSLTELANQWHAKGVLTLQNHNMQDWFDVDSGQIFSGNGIPVSDNLRFLGINAKNQAAYVYDQTDQVLYQSNGHGVKKTNKYNGMERFDSTLLLQGGTNKDMLMPPIIDGVDSLVLYGGANEDTYQFSKEMWAHYRTVIIDNDDPDDPDDSQPSLDHLILPIDSPESLLVSRRDDDLMLMDPKKGTELTVRRVFGNQAKAHQHLSIELEGASQKIDVEKLANKMSKKEDINNGLMNLSGVINSEVIKQPNIAAHTHTTVLEAKSPSLVKLSEAMASFPDIGGAYEHLQQNIQLAKGEQPLLLPNSNSVIG
ncbi:TcdA/TcdB pore-forming domain-containing protein [Xenorhabdus siamensis]|uniref:TcdA/TcdB pore-forming domain-containing protein n=1 Tax=Xenorhabdus siamensis TaxID=3136254 RepID=UPI0030F40C3E